MLARKALAKPEPRKIDMLFYSTASMTAHSAQAWVNLTTRYFLRLLRLQHSTVRTYTGLRNTACMVGVPLITTTPAVNERMSTFVSSWRKRYYQALISAAQCTRTDTLRHPYINQSRKRKSSCGVIRLATHELLICPNQWLDNKLQNGRAAHLRHRLKDMSLFGAIQQSSDPSNS